MAGTADFQAFDALAKHTHLSDLVALVLALATSAAETRATDWRAPDKLKSLVEARKLNAGETATPWGDPLRILEIGPNTPEEHALARALWAHAVAEMGSKSTEEEDHLAEQTLWLATHTPFDATLLLDRALGEDADPLWAAIAGRVRQIDQGRYGSGSGVDPGPVVQAQRAALGRSEALVGAAALGSSTSAAAMKQAALLANEVTDSTLARLLRREPRERDSEFEGEMLYAPHGFFGTTLLALTGLLLAMHALRLLARVALGYRKPAHVTISEHGARLRWRTEILGRTIRDHDILFAREGLASVVREVRYPRLAFYSGLFFLAIGSFVGVRTLADGVRAASPTLLIAGFGFVALGILLDVLLGSLVPGASGRCRLVFVPRAGVPICVAGVDTKQADFALARLAGAAR